MDSLKVTTLGTTQINIIVNGYYMRFHILLSAVQIIENGKNIFDGGRKQC
jgi:hypothetical protein